MGKKILRLLRRPLLGTALLFLAVSLVQAQQMADPNFNATVEHPAYTKTHPRVVVDEAYANFHTADGCYQPLARLLRSDGYEVAAASTRKFEPAASTE